MAFSSVPVTARASFPTSSISRAIANAVKAWSPVTIITLMPAILHFFSVALTSGRGGSCMPPRPAKVRPRSVARIAGVSLVLRPFSLYSVQRANRASGAPLVKTWCLPLWSLTTTLMSIRWESKGNSFTKLTVASSFAFSAATISAASVGSPSTAICLPRSTRVAVHAAPLRKARHRSGTICASTRFAPSQNSPCGVNP
ncbi:MAG: hypothetical protein DDT38_01029 [Firmicutes bacterium]|nr:hypothetical protein [candidate division NPL-UPA2 bacterium]